MILYEYARVRPGASEDSFRAWYDAQPSKVRSWLFQRLMTMQQYSGADFDVFAQGPIKEGGKKYPYIYKLKLGGYIEYRPLLCRGPKAPIEPHIVTFLLGATEVQDRITPSPVKAAERRVAILENPKLQRLLQMYDERTMQWLREDN